MTLFRADLHCHSTCSDGSLTPVELVQLASKSSLQGLAIADHDSVAAYGMALEEASHLKILLLPGVEFSCRHRNQNVHVLGYSFQPEHPDIQNLCSWHLNRRLERCHAILSRLQQLGKFLTLDQVKAQTTGQLIGRPHIAAAMVTAGMVSTVKEAFYSYLGDGKAAYVPGESVSVIKTIETLHAAGGVALIAHPHLIYQKELLDSLLTLPFDGLEGYYARFNAAQNRVWVEIGAKKKWIVSGGSDFHGAIKPDLPLGASWVNEETYRQLARLYK